jgi:hypothetical protein
MDEGISVSRRPRRGQNGVCNAGNELLQCEEINCFFTPILPWNLQLEAAMYDGALVVNLLYFDVTKEQYRCHCTACRAGRNVLPGLCLAVVEDLLEVQVMGILQYAGLKVCRG